MDGLPSIFLLSMDKVGFVYAREAMDTTTNNALCVNRNTCVHVNGVQYYRLNNMMAHEG